HIAARMLYLSRRLRAENLPDRVRAIAGVEAELLYLDCAGGELIRRYDETRRMHHTGPAPPAGDGISRERALTARLKESADSVLDTTALKPAEHRDELMRRYGGD